MACQAPTTMSTAAEEAVPPGTETTPAPARDVTLPNPKTSGLSHKNSPEVTKTESPGIETSSVPAKPGKLSRLQFDTLMRESSPHTLSPKQLDKMFTKYDRDKDGHIDKNELHAVFTSELNLEKTLDDVEKLMAKETGMNGVKHFLQQKSEYTIFLQSLPADLRGRIEDFDTNKDGELSAEEMTGILNAFYVAERERDHANQLARNWKMVSLAAFVAFISMCVAVFFASALATEWRKEMSVDSDGTIVSRDGAVLQTATKTTTRALTSRIPNKNLAQLSTFSYIDPTSGTTMSVHVNSFVRVPDQMAHCGSVVVLQTSLGNFTLDDTSLYHAELKQWVDVAGTFSNADRRRMLQSADDRRRLGATSGAAVFRFLADAGEELNCSMSWDGSETTVAKPHTPVKPYSYVVHNLISCWEPYKGSKASQKQVGGGSSPTGSDDRCISKYGPNAGKTKPGVSRDGANIRTVQHALYTDNMTIIISRYPNHPLQVLVEIQDLQNTTAADNVTKLSFQLYDGELSKRQRCIRKTVPKADNITFENSFLSYLGVRDQLRHWAISGRDGTRMADFYDDNSTGKPHSILFDKGEPTTSEVRYIQLDEQLADSDITAWLNAHFTNSKVYDMNDITNCEQHSMQMATPAMMGQFKESPNSVDWYTQKMLKLQVDPTFDEAMAETSMRRYWGSAMYLRRLLAQQTADYRSSNEYQYVPVVPQNAVEASLTLNFDDPWFWRELGTQWGMDNSTEQQYLDTVWLQVAASVRGPRVEAVREQAAQRSGLTIQKLMTVPVPVKYVAKAKVIDATGAEFSATDIVSVQSNWNLTKTVKSVDRQLNKADALYITFGNGSACSGSVYKVSNSNSPNFTVQVVATADDPTTVVNDETLAAVALSTAQIPAGTLAFFYRTYIDASAASCDPSESFAASNSGSGRRLASQVAAYDAIGNETISSRRQLWFWGNNRYEDAFKFGKTCKFGGKDGPGDDWLEDKLGFELPDALDHLGKILDYSNVCCGDSDNKKSLWFCMEILSCAAGSSDHVCGIQLKTDLATYPFVEKWVDKLGIARVDASIGLATIADSGGKRYRPLQSNLGQGLCKHGLEQKLAVEITGKPTYPLRPAFWYIIDGPELTLSGKLALTHQHCTTAYYGKSRDANKAINNVKADASMDASFVWSFCTDPFGGRYGLSFNLDFSVGLTGSFTRFYDRGHSVGAIGGYATVAVSSAITKGKCECSTVTTERWIGRHKSLRKEDKPLGECKAKLPRSLCTEGGNRLDYPPILGDRYGRCCKYDSNPQTPAEKLVVQQTRKTCKTILAVSVEGGVSVELNNIAIGDGSDGISLTASVYTKTSYTWGGVERELSWGTMEAETEKEDLLDLDELGGEDSDGHPMND